MIIILVRVFAITGLSFITNAFNYRDRSFASTGALRIHYWLLLGLNPETLAESVATSVIVRHIYRIFSSFVFVCNIAARAGRNRLPLGLVAIVCLSGSS